MSDEPTQDEPKQGDPSQDAPRRREPRPLVCELEPGKHAICACGLTANAPFCDGTHSKTEKRPVIENVEDIAKNIAWCTCNASKNPPFCDGSHRRFWDDPSKPPMKPKED